MIGKLKMPDNQSFGDPTTRYRELNEKLSRAVDESAERAGLKIVRALKNRLDKVKVTEAA